MTRHTRDRWTLPSLNPAALEVALTRPGEPQAAGVDLPSWATAALTYDVDEVLLLEVRCWRPGRSVADIMRDLSDQLSAHGWTQAPAPSSGPLPWMRPQDGVMCPGMWSTWVRREVST